MNKFKKSDKVVCVNACNSYPKLTKGKVYNVIRHDQNAVKLLEHSVVFCSSRFKLVDPMSHLYDNEKPFGLLSEEEQNHLKIDISKIEWFNPKGKWVNKPSPDFSNNQTYRLKRPPERVSITSLTGTVEMKDGKPDWTTYKE